MAKHLLLLDHLSRHDLRCVYLILMLLLQVACATAPIQEMSDARQSLQAAKELKSNLTITRNLHSAETLLEQAQLAMEQGDYQLARSHANRAKAIANSAQQWAQIDKNN